MSNPSFKDKSIWITGASSGIGKSLFLELAKKEPQAYFVLSARREQLLNELIIQSQLPSHRCLILPYDAQTLTDEQANEMVSKIISRFKAIHYIFHNAGVSTRYYIKDSFKTDVDKRVMQINFFSAITLTKAALPQMIKQNQGHLIVITSIFGKLGWPERSAYAASKHALHGYFDSLRTEFVSNNIKVTLVVPGAVNTELAQHAVRASGETYNKADPTLRSGMSAEVCAQKIIAAALKQRNEVCFGGKEVLLVYLKRISPNFLIRLAARMAKNIRSNEDKHK